MTEKIENPFLFPPSLETDRLILRRMRLSDAKDLFAFTHLEAVAKYVLWSKHKSIRESRRYIRFCKKQYRNGFPGVFSVVYKASGHMIGTIGFVGFYPEHRCAEIGYSLNPDYWNQGIMTEALNRMIRYAFDDLKLHRLEACYDIHNPASGRVMEKCGMHLEGTMTDKYNNKGVFCTVNLYAIIKNDHNGG